MEQKVEEFKKDIAELEALLQQAERQKVKDFLSVQLRKLISEQVSLEESLKCNTLITTSAKVTANRKYQVKLNNYAWDQTQKYIKFFVSLEGVQNIPEENVVCRFTANSLELEIKDLNGKDYIFSINKLLNSIVPSNSSWIIKTDMVVITASKADHSIWSHVTQIEKSINDAKAKKYEVDKTADTTDSLMNLMRKMYEDGDDNMKREISKAMYEGQKKQNFKI